MKNVTCKKGFWHMYTGNDSEVCVQRLPNGSWMATMGLTLQIDPCGSSAKQEVFENVRDALRWVGYPAEQWIGEIYFEVPKELI